MSYGTVYSVFGKTIKPCCRNKITSRNGKPYGSSMIRNVFNGLNENEDIENAIIALFIQTQEDIKETVEERNRILGIS